MHAQRALRAIVLTFILTIGSFITVFITPTVNAQPTPYTTVYFTNALNSSIFGYGGGYGGDYGFGFAPVSLNPPVNANDSFYPPTIFVKNTTKLLPHYNLNSDELITWFASWIVSVYSGELGNYSFLQYLLPSPLKILEEYDYNGDNTVTINGDLAFNLYFKPPENTRPKFRDQVNVSLFTFNQNSIIPFPKHVANTTVTLLSGLTGGIYNQVVILPDVQLTLTPGTSLLFSVEIIPTNKTIPTLFTKLFNVSRFLNRWQDRASRWENRSLPTLQNIGTTLKDLLSTIEEIGSNISSADIAAILNAVISTKLVYDSVLHPSSVTVPAAISEEDIRDYYLHNDQVMSETQPEGTNRTRTKLNTTATIWTADQPLERNKILLINNVTAELYFYRALTIFPGKVKVNATLYDDTLSIASTSMTLTRADTQAFYQGSPDPVIFNFSGQPREMAYGHTLRLGISIERRTFTPVQLQYGSTAYPSVLRVKFEETQNIQVRDVTIVPADQLIVPGGSVEYIYNVTSKLADNISVSFTTRTKTGEWKITTPSSMSVAAGSTTRIPVFFNSTDYFKAAYGDAVNGTVTVSGTTGITKKFASAEVSRDAIHYDVEILDYQSNITMKKGETKTFYFIIKNNNTGAVDDTDNYTVSAASQNQWPVIPRDFIRNILRGGTSTPKDARVTITVPENTTVQSDKITIKVVSETNPATSANITITVHVQPPGILESLYNSFSSLADSLGLTSIFGDYAPIVLAAILMIIILFIIIILAFVLTLKDIRIICTDRIKEIQPDQTAVFDISLKNPTNKPYSYEVTTQQTGQPHQWAITAEPPSVQIDSKQTRSVKITVVPDESVMPNDWTEITVNVNRLGKKKIEHISLMAMIKEGKTLLQIQNVTHWPIDFNVGDRVVTSFSIENKGSISARNINVFFYINGKQKYKIPVTIPAGGIADIQTPWVAQKGKNKVRIRLKE